MRYFRTPAALPWLFTRWEWRVAPKGSEKSVYLTFDDGPMPGPTDFVLHELARADAKATFFCIGDNVRKHPDTFQSVLQAGHRVGNHTYHHVRGWGRSVGSYLEETQACADLLPVEAVPLFRPPYGRITLAQSRQLRKAGYRIVMWDVLTCDYDPTLDTADALVRICRATRPGSIVVFHDSLKAEPQLRAMLPGYLKFLQAEGYAMKSLPE